MSNPRVFPAGTILAYSADGINYVDLADLKMVTPPNLERPDSRDTDLSSPLRTHIYSGTGWIEPGEVPFVLYMDKGQMLTLLNFFGSGVTLYWAIIFPLIGAETTPSEWNFVGYLKTLKTDQMTVDNNEKVTMPMSIKVSGPPEFTPGS